MSARLRRLAADYKRICDEFTGHPYIKVEPTGGNPPERYLVTYRLKGLEWDHASQTPVIREFHQMEIYLHNDYPRQKPKCVMKTPIFHPNFGDWVCIGDFWAAGETLCDVIIQVGEMIQYQSYNPKSPLNAVAARWCVENEHLLPVGNAKLYMAEPDIEITLEEDNEDLGIELLK